ncbi:hypothetical protein HKD37_10G029543 [Glycine soja]|nr:hypothetical protein GmHk_10G030079 [Glycine max]
MSHYEEETPKNESHKQEEHKMVKKTLSSYELNSNNDLRTRRGKGGIVCTNVVHNGETSTDTRISKGDISDLTGHTT